MKNLLDVLKKFEARSASSSSTRAAVAAVREAMKTNNDAAAALEAAALALEGDDRALKVLREIERAWKGFRGGGGDDGSPQQEPTFRRLRDPQER